MQKAPKKKSQNVDVGLVLPALLLIAAYGVIVYLRGAPAGLELAAKQRAYQDAKAAAVPPTLVEQLARESADLKTKIAEAEESLAETRKEGESLARKQSKPLGRIEVVAQIENLVKNRGLEVTRVKGAETAGDTKMAASLQRGASALVDALAKAKPDPAPAAPPAPGAPPAPAPPPPQQNLGAPPLDLREMEIRGSYQDMLAALWDLSNGAGESVVVSLGLERPATNGKSRDPLIWRVVVHVQPGAAHHGHTVEPPAVQPAVKPERLASDKRK